ncbi:toll/interleukin-1 receptor-like protein [Cryptomeria japonica]|uniref:toll/interleukin-1 receptor-like protein n=1 Tax=Cryptomeria japonica TaxID=3369 RepID=UPI0027DA7B7D|nr:toll/interleukin-1 receptor-like protein [Cryptomeria japonica]
MEIINPLCLLTMYCPSLCLAPTSMHSYINPKCSVPIALCLPPMENNQPYECSENNECVHSSWVPNYDVFLNHRGKDVKETVASLIFHNLKNKGLKVFLDKNSIQVGSNIPQVIGDAIYSASIHVVIISANYAESSWCLKELTLIFKTGAPIIPVFCGVEPSELRMKDKDGVYARAFQKHKQSGNFEPHAVEEWRKAFREVSYIKGYIFTGDQGELLEKIATSVAELIGRGKSQPKQKNKETCDNSHII